MQKREAQNDECINCVPQEKRNLCCAVLLVRRAWEQPQSHTTGPKHWI